MHTLDQQITQFPYVRKLLTDDNEIKAYKRARVLFNNTKED